MCSKRYKSYHMIYIISCLMIEFLPLGTVGVVILLTWISDYVEE